ncbi:MAG: class I SAM-dependent methyltransferase [Spirochaetes bacterium]|nr:class I SAM-dependent methyltransferase [Spirochaetota bacterium]
MLNTENGYNLFYKNYKDEYKYLDSFDWDLFLNLFKKNIIDKDNINIMILGCGDGRETLRIYRLLKKLNKNFNLYGVDISEKMLSVLKKKLKKLDINEKNFFKYDFLDNFDKKFINYFDFVIGLFILVHIKPIDLTKFFDNIKQILKKEGYFIFNNIPQKEGKVLKVNNHKFVIEFFDHNIDKVIEVALNSGFTFIKKESNFFEKKLVSDILLFKN